MLNPKYKRYVDRLCELSEESVHILATRIEDSEFSSIKDKVRLKSWVTKVENIIEIACGKSSPHYKALSKLTSRTIEHPYQINAVTGVLSAAIDDISNGFLTGQEFIIAGEIFDSVLEESRQLFYTHHKDAAAVLCRVVLEDSLKRIARQESIDDNQKASKINEELKKKGRYGQPQWRMIQAWLDIGNSAAHGKFTEYTEQDVKGFIDGVESFIGIQFA
ncbi:DUF4145 domain-containing protein [Paenibacillus phytohabitans]|uniref:DUF4145 domain-containing protein n=1 Tax=Paenibacillus phytohabitans TaxID=2654978 RepID=UPI00300A8F87